MPEGSPVEFGFEPLRDGETVELGRTRVEVIDSPGHTWAHSCLLVTDTSRGEEAWVVFTCDTLLVGTVGRPDLHGEERELAAALHRTLRERLLTLPDWIEVMPGHVSGSACGAGISSNPSSTIGFERRRDTLLSEDDPDRFGKARVRTMAIPAASSSTRLPAPSGMKKSSLSALSAWTALGSSLSAVSESVSAKDENAAPPTATRIPPANAVAESTPGSAS